MHLQVYGTEIRQDDSRDLNDLCFGEIGRDLWQDLFKKRIQRGNTGRFDLVEENVQHGSLPFGTLDFAVQLTHAAVGKRLHSVKVDLAGLDVLQVPRIA